MSEAAPSGTEPAWPAMTIAQADALLTQPGSPFEVEDKIVRGVPLKVWKHAPPTLRDLWELGHAHAERTFMVNEDERVTFDAFNRAVVAFAHELRGRGVAKGDRVAIILRNLPEWPVAFFAAQLIGAVATPLNAWWTGAELCYGLVDSGAKVAVIDAQRLARMAEHLGDCPELERIYASRLAEEVSHPKVTRLEDVLGGPNDWAELKQEAPPEIELDPDDDATLFYTSGTTGSPKGALGTHRNAISAMYISPYSAARNLLRKGETPTAPDPDAPQRRALLSIPFFHVTGCFALLCVAVYGGLRIVMQRKWEPEEAFRLIEREKINLAGGVPTIAWQILEHPARQNYDLSSLDTLSYGGAPAAPELVRRIREVFPKAEGATGWGMTETSATFTHFTGKDYQNRPDSCGLCPPVGELKVVGADGRTLPPGEVGELWARGPNVVRGYLNKPEATAKTFVDGWVVTGDMARLDEEGFCYIVDRAKDMIIRGGENIYCSEVEAVLFQHPAVMDAALVPSPHKILGEEPAAVVTLTPGSQASEDELRAWVGARMAAFNTPVKVIFWPEPLPRNPNGKILKTELKKLFATPAEA
jgi:steroid-24-oyl-CoA synthetase